MSNWVSVYTTQAAHRAEIVKSILEEEELSPVIINKKDSSYKFGYYEVLVVQEEAVEAANLIRNEIEFE
jgi:hypothetical protein